MDEFERLCRDCAPVVYRYLLSLCGDEDLAGELTDETFYQAYVHIGSFRGESKVETWLCRIAKNAFFKEARRRKRTVPWDAAHGAKSAGDLFDAVLDREQAMRIHRQLHRLREPQREVFTLRVLGELSFREIADVFGRTESWAKVTFYRAKNKLIEAMEEEYGREL